MKTLHPRLREFGLTPEMIMRHVVSIALPAKLSSKYNYHHKHRNAFRARNLAAGLTVEGKPRRRLPNGQRKPR